MATPISEGQRKVLADRLYDAALINISKASEPPEAVMDGEFPSASAKSHAEAARALVQAWSTCVNPGGGRR